jgi:transcription antitermination factor NusG
MIFDGFSGEDFDAYAPSKWSSNMFTLQRRKVKDKLDVLGKQLAGEFGNAGLELILHLSDDHPSLWNSKKVDTQWLFFSRDTNAQRELSDIIDTEKTLAATLVDPTPLYRHIFLGVSINETALEIGIRLHHDAWVDRKNLLAILNDEERRKGFISLCQSLPAQIGFGLHQTELTAVGNLEGDTLQAFQNEFDTSSKGWMFLGARIARDEVMNQGADIALSVISIMSQLVPVYKYIAWSPQNDALSIDTIVEQKKQERLATHEELLHAQQEREEKQRKLVARRQQEQEAKKQEMLDEQAWREQERAKRRAMAMARREKEAHTHSSAGLPSSTNANVSTPSPSLTDAPVAADNRPIERKDTERAPDRSSRSDQRRKERSFTSRNPGRNDSSRRKDKRENSRNKSGGKESQSFKSASSRNTRPVNVSDERKADIQVGDRIVVVSGLLKDRSGIVQNIDEKGDLKVSFGMLSSRVARKDAKGLGPTL